MLFLIFPLVSLALLPTASAQAPATRRPIRVSVVDDASGQPIPGARVLSVDERAAPVWGEVWTTAEQQADSDGRAELQAAQGSDDPDWVIVQADGYGATGTSSFGKDGTVEFRLRPETPITIELVDFLGRPLPLAHLGVAFGCGHTPDLVTATTGPDGRAALRGVTDYDRAIEDLYVVHPKISQPYYDSVPFGAAKNGVARLYCEPGCLIEGRIVLASGEPAVGYSVGNNETHRGHWARTNQRGEFCLFGCEPQTDYLSVITPGSDRKTFFHGARAGVYRTLQLNGTDQPEAREDGDEDARRKTSEVRVQVNAPNPLDLDLPERLRWIPVAIWNPDNGLTKWDETDEEGFVSFSVTAGEYLLEVGGPNSPYAAVPAGKVTVDGGEEPVSVECELPAPRVGSLEILGLGEGQGVSIQTAGGYYRRYKLKGPDARVPQFLFPSGRWSAHTFVEDESGVQRRRDLIMPPGQGKHLSLRAPR